MSNETTIQEKTLSGNAPAILASRVAYFLDLNGPCMAVDTACSSSLTAIHLAIKSMLAGDCNLALAGGVSILASPLLNKMVNKIGLLSPTGKCKTFDASADGFLLSEGVGVLILKRLEKAVKDNDYIYGIIKSSGINQNGFSNSLEAPKASAQAKLQKKVYQKAGIKPETIDYIEVQGASSVLGDAIEIAGLKESFGNRKDNNQYCAIGSLKPNIGHALMASGVGAIIKVLMALQYNQLPPTINIDNLNKELKLGGSPFYVNQKLKEWIKRGDTPRRAAVNGFGLSGANVHIIIEEAPKQAITEQATKPYYLITLSSKTEESLKQREKDLYRWLEKLDRPNQSTNDNNRRKPSLSAISYTLNVGRSHFKHRSSLVVSSINELKEKLHVLIAGKETDNYFSGTITNKKPDDAAIYEEVLERVVEKLESINYQNTKQYRKQLRTLSNLYVKGYDLDWELLHQNESKQKISLPTYPFMKERYWVTDKNKEVNNFPTSINWLQNGVNQLEKEDIKLGLIKIVSTVIRLPEEKVNFDISFNNIGIDSITGVSLIKKIQEIFGITLEPAVISQYPTISGLANYIYNDYHSKVSKFLNKIYKNKSIVDEDIVKTASALSDGDITFKEALNKISAQQITVE